MEYICPNCKYIGEPGKKKRGSKNIEFAMWCIFPLGLPYIFWRMTGKKDVCKECSSEILIPLESRLGKAMAANEGREVFLKENVQKNNDAEIKVEVKNKPEPPPETLKPAEERKPRPQNPDEW